MSTKQSLRSRRSQGLRDGEAELQKSPWQRRKRTRRRDPDYDLKKQAVMDAAARLFDQKGYVNTTLDEIADALNVTKPTLYYYFSNKDQILFEIQKAAQAAIEAALNEANEHGDNGLAKLEAFVRRYIEGKCQTLGRVVVKTGRQGLSRTSQAKINKRYRYVDTLLRDIIREGIEDGSIAPVDVKMATFLIYGALNWVAYWYQSDGPYSPDEVADKFLEILRSGFVPRQ